MKKAFLFCAAWLMLACGSGNRNLNEVVSIDYEALESTEFFSTNTFSKAEPVYLDTNGAILGSPLYMKIKNGNYYIFDNQQQYVYTFDSKGNMLSRLARIGRAKGEYTFVKDFDIQSNGNIELLCEVREKLLRYTPDGEFIGETMLGYPASSFLITDNGYLFTKSWRTDSLTGDNTVIIKDANLNILRRMLPKNEFRFANWPNMSFSQSGSQPPLYKHVYDNKIYRIVNNTLQLACEIDFGTLWFPEEFFIMEDTEKVLNILMNNTFATVSGAFENRDYFVLYVAEEGKEDNRGYILYDKVSGKSSFQRFKSSDDTAVCFGRPVALTEQNEIVFIAEPESLKEIAQENALFKNIDKSRLQEGCGYVILKMKIK